MRLKLGQLTTIVISSAAAAREVLQTHDRLFFNRTIPDAIRACQHSDVLDANMNLRHKKVEELLVDVHKSAQAGEAVDIEKAAFKTSLNLLCTTFFSIEYLADHESGTIREFKETIWSIKKEVGAPNLADYFPMLGKVDPQGIRRRTTIYFRKVMDFFGNIINQRLQLREETGSTEDNDVSQTLINMMINKQSREDEQLDRTTIEHLLLDLFAGGTETTSATLEWSIAELLKAPEVMSRAQAELEQVIGKGNQVKESDISQLPYLQAIIKEIFRLHPTIPLLLPRKAEKDVEIFGYTIPKGAQMLVNVWAISRDSTIWENPNEFKPESGRRICPGMPLAIRMLHLMLGSLLHTFDWKLEDGVTPETIDMEDKFGITLQRAKPLRALRRIIT
ncbi:hypothetical protein TIFTF001_018370 [Ficus carica]|uniref:Cytochrome P450 n=1 Tax=Ficus carica TaxID=3494 RepID=A0AA88ARV8_FICCA|nr:hypothetical protein TIFTF001_018370 [Ficus carica]